MKEEHNNLGFVHTKSSSHRLDIESSYLVGCFYCKQIYPSEEIQEWTDNEQTAICPKCKIDSVLPSEYAYPELLDRMHRAWFQ